MPAAAANKELTATLGRDQDEECRNPFQLALGVTGKRAAKCSSSQALKTRSQAATGGRSQGPNATGSAGLHA